MRNSRAFGALTERQADLMREAEPERMNLLDEDDLLDLHTRIRRARNKYVAAVKSGTGPDSVGAGNQSASVESGRRRAKKTTGGRKRDASSIAPGSRRQAKRDSRCGHPG